MPLVVPEPLDPKEVADSAHWLAQAYDAASNMVRFVGMSAEDYRAAAFLDDRIFGQQRDVRVLPWADVATAMAGWVGEPARWIFHIGHVGSTMVARMLGEANGVLSLREPRILRDLAALSVGEATAMAPTVSALCSRANGEGEVALVKATSFVSEIAPMLVAAGQPAILMHVSASSYIATILAGENSVKELHALHDTRAKRMTGRATPMPDAAMSDAHRAAMAWACEMTSLEAAAAAMPDRPILWLDFDRFLARPAVSLLEAAAHCGIALSEAEANAITTGPLMQRYSKALEYDYGPALRRELQEESRQLHGPAIKAALAILLDASGSSPLLERALKRA